MKNLVHKVAAMTLNKTFNTSFELKKSVPTVRTSGGKNITITNLKLDVSLVSTTCCHHQQCTQDNMKGFYCIITDDDAEPMCWKRTVLRITVVLFFLHCLFSSHIYCICCESFIFSKPCFPEKCLLLKRESNPQTRAYVFVHHLVIQGWWATKKQGNRSGRPVVRNRGWGRRGTWFRQWRK